MANLLRRMKGFAQEMAVMLESGRTTQNSPALLHHFRVWDARSTREKYLFYLRRGIKKIVEEPENPRAHFELGAQYLMLGKLEKAQAMLRKAVLLKERKPPAKPIAAYYYSSGARKALSVIRGQRTET